MIKDAKGTEYVFGRCRGCHKVRWLTDTLLSKIGMGCHFCKAPGWTPIMKLSLYDRAQIFYWMMWEHFQINPKSLWYLNPYYLARTIYASATPRLQPTIKMPPRDDDLEEMI